MILIKNGRVVDAKSNTDEVLDVVIDGGKIKTIGKVEDDGSYEQVIDADYKMNPPLRAKADREALKEGLKEGVMDVISTDHAPHHRTEKERPFAEAPFGITGLETSVSLTITELVDKGVLTPLQMAERMSYKPAQIINSDKGTLLPGRAADITIIDPNEEYVIDSTLFASMGKNTPFNGKTVKGRVRYTMSDGKVVYSYRPGCEIIVDKDVPKLI